MDRKYSMLPSFEIYLSILTDDLMPWLMENRRQEKFESVIRQAGSGFYGDYRIFFISVGLYFKKLHPVSSKKVIRELEHLSNVSATPLGKEMAQVFATRPVQNYREHFYNAITGMCLGAYHDSLVLFFRKCEGPETKAFYLEKLFADLHSILLIPLPEKIENREEEKIVIHVKLALAILFQIVLKKHRITGNGMLRYFDTHGWLKETREKLQFGSLTDELLMNFDSFTENSRPKVQEKAMDGRGKREDLADMEFETGDNVQIQEILKDLQQEFSEVKQGFENMAVNKQLPEKKVVPSEKWMTGSEVCEYLRISKSTLQRRRGSGKIKFSKLAGKYRYEVNYIRQLLRENDRTPSSPEIEQELKGKKEPL